MTGSALPNAQSAIAECESVVDRLHKMCCDPGRSPSLAAIEDSLLAIRRDLDLGDPGSLNRALQRVQEVGGVLGSLQVACCAPPRMSLYAEALVHLNTIQLEMNAALGRSH